jgi:DNA-binding NarL/FixJ family response regulator
MLFAPSDNRGSAVIRRARILVVEDDYLVALEAEHRLVQAGFDVVGIAGTAEEALAKAAAEKPELAIMDINLGGIRDGVDAAIELLAKFGIPSIFASAYGDRETRDRAARANPLGWLEKPYSPESLVALVALVKAALAKHR